MKFPVFALSFLFMAAAIPVAAQETDLSTELKRLSELAINTLEQRSESWRCESNSVYACNNNGCSKNLPTVWINLDFRLRAYERCDDRGCDRYVMEHKSSGIYTIIEVPLRTTFLKSLNDGSEFLEVVSLGTTV